MFTCIYRVWQVPHKTRGASAAAARAAERVAMEEQRRNQSYQLLSDSEEEEVVPAKVSIQGLEREGSGRLRTKIPAQSTSRLILTL